MSSLRLLRDDSRCVTCVMIRAVNDGECYVARRASEICEHRSHFGSRYHSALWQFCRPFCIWSQRSYHKLRKVTTWITERKLSCLNRLLHRCSAYLMGFINCPNCVVTFWLLFGRLLHRCAPYLMAVYKLPKFCGYFCLAF
jgi:hypothetical protein